MWEDVGSNPTRQAYIHGPLAQLVEQETLNLFVGGSIPSRFTKEFFTVAQLVEQTTVNRRVAGSSPARGAKLERWQSGLSRRS